MRLKLDLALPNGGFQPISVSAEATATVADVAGAIRAGVTQLPHPAASPLTLQVMGSEGVAPTTLSPRSLLQETSLRSGQRVRVTESATGPRDATSAPARLRIVAGHQEGKIFPLRFGPNIIGRGAECDVVLLDHQVSRRHARLTVSDQIGISDLNSSNGVLVEGDLLEHAVLSPRDTVVLGETTVVVERNPALLPASTRFDTDFNRSPLVRPRYEGRTFEAPTAPGKQPPGKLPLIAMIAPLVMGVVMYLATRNLLSIIFVALSPVIALGTYLDRRWTDGKSKKAAQARFAEDLDALSGEVEAALAEESAARCSEFGSLDDVVASAFSLTPDLWHRRPEDDDFGLLKLGYGRAASRHRLALPERGEADADTWEKMLALKERAAFVEDVPIVTNLRECGNLGLAGDPEWFLPIARGLVAQLTCLHSPAELVIAAVASGDTSRRWNWLMWLPHVGSPHSPMQGAHLAASAGAAGALVSALEEIVAARKGPSALHVPTVVLLVEDDAPVERGRLVSLAEDGPAVGVHLIWMADRHERLPAACHSYLVLDPLDHSATAGFVRDHTTTRIARVEELSEQRAAALARQLAPVQDAGAPVLDYSGLPRSVSYLALAGEGLALDPQVSVERWRENGSVGPGPRPRGKAPATLRALVGQGSQGDFVLDLRAQGPHALVGGTSGAGKSEFLQSWILGLAAGHSPQRVTFLFVDYKGGSAFADCVRLPHSVGLVTDLSPHLVRRALTSLRAELRYREHLLNRKNAKDLISLERTGDPECPPSLVIVVDEFAALVTEVPDFVDGVVDVAQRGRSLGLHLILATQRPAGVIKGNLRANTALRIALRMADESDSADVVDSSLAAEFDPRIPGRAAVRTGPGRISVFQAGYAGGWTSSRPEPPRIEIESLTFGDGVAWEIPSDRSTDEAREEGPTDIARAVTTIGRAADLCSIPAPRKPWLPELGSCYSLEDLLKGAGEDDRLLLGLADDPAHQAQHPAFFDPDLDGNLAVLGAGGSGKSAVLRALACSAATRRSRTEVYALDFATAGLGMLESLPTVGAVIEGSDHERIDRLMRRLTEVLDERAARYAAARAGSIGEYRATSGRSDEARILVLVDGFTAFRDEFEAQASTATFGRFTRLLAEGRGAGIHVVLTAERPGAIPASIGASIPRRLALRLADENAYASLSVPKDILGSAPPGRAVFGGESNELQVAVPGGSPLPAEQAAAIDSLAARMRKAGIADAQSVRRLPALVRPEEVPAAVDDQPVLGLEEAGLAPFGFAAQGAFLIAGMPGSGRTSALRWISQSLRRWAPALPMYYIGPRRSRVHADPWWTGVALDTEAIRQLAADLKPLVEQPVPEGNEPGLVLVIESLGELVSTPAENPVLEVVKLARRNGHLVVGEQDTSAWASGWPLISEIRNTRHGIVMQPDPNDGDILFKAVLPRVKRADYPLGRGVYVRSGKLWTVQLPLPD